MIDPPSTLTSGTKKESDSGENRHDDNDDNKEHFGWGLGGWGLGGWGNWGGWGVYGPYRFGFMCNGYPGWAYPLGY
ncbi:hypothetical protein PsorP6_017699 [Peronosclerospora sorghi]|uniref:Uncharacterized protein n=1 Tax=Peronosclerospora sorghi TaxID=230839 RepID=A0ACC0WM37_9STRA|nr:hypothetical protein PsorP6_017699 [Peronosclerospora sorghi]